MHGTRCPYSFRTVSTSHRPTVLYDVRQYLGRLATAPAILMLKWQALQLACDVTLVQAVYTADTTAPGSW